MIPKAKPKRKPLLKLPTQYEVDKMRNKDKSFLQKKGKGK